MPEVKVPEVNLSLVVAKQFPYTITAERTQTDAIPPYLFLFFFDLHLQRRFPSVHQNKIHSWAIRQTLHVSCLENKMEYYAVFCFKMSLLIFACSLSFNDTNDKTRPTVHEKRCNLSGELYAQKGASCRISLNLTRNIAPINR